MSLVPVYRSRPSTLHAARAGAGAGLCSALALTGALYLHPLILSAALGAIVLTGVLAGVGREIGRSLRFALPFALLIAVINPLVYPEGDTLLFRGGEVLGREVDITLEATAAGIFNGLRVIVIVTAFGLMSAAVDPDELLRMFRRVSYRSALTATLATRLVPVLARDAGRMSGRAGPGGGRGRGARGARLFARWADEAARSGVVAARLARCGGGRRLDGGVRGGRAGGRGVGGAISDVAGRDG